MLPCSADSETLAPSSEGTISALGGGEFVGPLTQHGEIGAPSRLSELSRGSRAKVTATMSCERRVKFSCGGARGGSWALYREAPATFEGGSQTQPTVTVTCLGAQDRCTHPFCKGIQKSGFLYEISYF